MKKSLSITLLLFRVVAAVAQTPLSFKDPLTGMYGFKDAQGKVIIPAVFRAVTQFNSDLSLAQEPTGGIAIPIKPSGFPLGNDYHIADAQKVLLGGLYGEHGGKTMEPKNPEAIPSTYNSILFSYVEPAKRMSVVKNSALSVNKNAKEGEVPVVAHKKSGLSYMHMYTFFDREEHSSIIANSSLFRMRIPIEFVSEKTDAPYGFGLEFQFWLDGSGECKDAQHIALIVRSDNTLQVFDKRIPYADNFVCGGWNCWNGKKKMEYQDIGNYKQVATYSTDKGKPVVLEVIRNREEFYIYLNDQLAYQSPIPACDFGYGDFPIPLFYNKGEFRFLPGTEYTIYRHKSR